MPTSPTVSTPPLQWVTTASSRPLRARSIGSRGRTDPPGSVRSGSPWVTAPATRTTATRSPPTRCDARSAHAAGDRLLRVDRAVLGGGQDQLVGVALVQRDEHRTRDRFGN